MMVQIVVVAFDFSLMPPARQNFQTSTMLYHKLVCYVHVVPVVLHRQSVQYSYGVLQELNLAVPLSAFLS